VERKLITQQYLRGCGHIEILTIDETVSWYQKKLARIAQTRCAKCVQKIKDEDAKRSAAHKEKKSQDRIRAHKEYIAHQKLKLAEAKNQNKATATTLNINLIFNLGG
jgi:predicted amidophosphoribosyltransferase